MTTLTALKKIRKLLEDPSRWTKRVFSATDGSGTRYCLVGAHVEIEGLGGYCAVNTFGDWPVDFNDAPDTTHDDILMFLDNCIMDETLRSAR